MVSKSWKCQAYAWWWSLEGHNSARRSIYCRRSATSSLCYGYRFAECHWRKSFYAETDFIRTGIRARRPATCIPLARNHIQARLYVRWTLNAWTPVLFSDGFLRDPVVKCLTRNPGVLGSSRTGSSVVFEGVFLGNTLQSPSLVKPRKVMNDLICRRDD